MRTEDEMREIVDQARKGWADDKTKTECGPEQESRGFHLGASDTMREFLEWTPGKSDAERLIFIISLYERAAYNSIRESDHPARRCAEPCAESLAPHRRRAWRYRRPGGKGRGGVPLAADRDSRR